MEDTTPNDLNPEIDLEEAPTTEDGIYPLNMTAWDHWMVTPQGTKKARHVTRDDADAYSWSDPDNWSSFSKVGMAIEDSVMDAEYAVFVLDRDDDQPYTDNPDPFAYIDFDDARDPETGEIHPYVRGIVERAGSYAGPSSSGEGVHIEVIGELPEDVTQIKDKSLPDHPDFPDATIEVYDGKRIDIMSGKRFEACPEEATENDDLLATLADQFLSEEERTDSAGSYGGREPERSREEIEEMETGTIEDIKDAIAHIGPRDISLRSECTKQGKNGRWSWDPCWGYQSNSRETLGYDENQDIWIWRNGDMKLNALDVVALEERYITEPGEAVTGKDFIDALDDLRRRGASIPKLEPTGQSGEDRLAEYDDIDPEVFERESTTSMRVFSAAMKNVQTNEIWLSSQRFEAVNEYTFHDHETEELVDVLQAVAFDEGIVDDPKEPVQGRINWIKLGHTLRMRGGTVPQYKKNGGARRGGGW